jgi:hypothetical protein
MVLTDPRPNPEIRLEFRQTALQINRREYEARFSGGTRDSPRSHFTGDFRRPRGSGRMAEGESRNQSLRWHAASD